MKTNPLQILGVSILMLSTFATAPAQERKQIVQLAKLEVDPAQLDAYKAALKQGVETALRVEPGVLRLDAMADKENPAHITLLEVYADEAAYQAHLQAPHFLKYKTETKEMVKSLELVRMVALFPGLEKPK
jgi:4-carboxymuconolactone decarboxylase